MNNKMVSVVIPLYNTEKYIHICVDSVLAQDYDDFELLIIDDGSTDASPAIADAYAAANQDCVRVIHQKNRGLSGARNAGLSEAQGKYVMFLDSDDFLEPDCLGVLVRKAETECCDMVVMPTKNVNPDGTEESREPLEVYSRHFGEKEYLIRYNVTPRLYLRSMLQENNLTFPEGELLEDITFCLMANFYAKHFALIDYYGYCYRLNPDGIMGGIHKKGVANERIPYQGLEHSIQKVLAHWHAVSVNATDGNAVSVNATNSNAADARVLEYCVVRVLVTILFVMCRRSEVATVLCMCRYCYQLLGKYFADFMHNPYFNVHGEEHVPPFQSKATWLFRILYRTRLLKAFAVLYTRF